MHVLKGRWRLLEFWWASTKEFLRALFCLLAVLIYVYLLRYITEKKLQNQWFKQKKKKVVQNTLGSNTYFSDIVNKKRFTKPRFS